MKRFIKWFISILLFGLAIALLDWQNLKSIFYKISPRMFCLATLVAFFQFAAMGIRWHYLIRSVSKLSFRNHISQFLYSAFLNVFTPANIGGDMYRLFWIEAERDGRWSILSALLKERLLGIASFLFCYIAIMVILFTISPFPNSPPDNNIFFYSGIFILVALSFAPAVPLIVKSFFKIKLVQSKLWSVDLLTQIQKAFHFSTMNEFLMLIGLSVLSLIIWISAVKIVAVDLGIDISWLVVGQIAILVELVRLIPVNIQGIGIREGGFAYLFNVIGQSPETGFALGTISYLALSVAILLAGTIGKLISSSHFILKNS